MGKVKQLAALLLAGTTILLAQKPMQVPHFKVDPFWPKPLPNHWHIGQTIGVDVDAQDHVWIIHRADSLTESEVGAEGAKAPRARRSLRSICN